MHCFFYLFFFCFFSLTCSISGWSQQTAAAACRTGHGVTGYSGKQQRRSCLQVGLGLHKIVGGDCGLVKIKIHIVISYHEIQFFDIFASWFLERDKTQRTKKSLIGMSWTCRKKSDQSNNFWVSYGPLKYVYKW